MMLSADNIWFSYKNTSVLQSVTFDLTQGTILSIIGPNGAGKSTLIKCLIKILYPQQGRIFIEQSNLKNLKRRELARILGYVPQKSATTFPMTVFDTILMGRRPYCGWRSGNKDIQLALDILDLLDSKDLAMKTFGELSGGQQQKILLGRALSQQPKLFVLDEPTSNLDIKQQMEVMDILRQLVDQTGVSVVMAIHDLNLATLYSDSILLLKDGVVHGVGGPLSVITKENIEKVYGVEVSIINNNGKPHVLPVVRDAHNAPDHGTGNQFIHSTITR